MKIGMFDSGTGGLTVLYKALKALPNEEFIYYSDGDHVPYGTKTNDEVQWYCDEIVGFMMDEGCDAVVVACNTATSVAASYLRGKYNIPIIGVEPAVKPAVENNKEGRILVIATPITVREKKLHDLVIRYDDKKIVDMLALPKLPVYAERAEFDSDEVYEYLKEEFSKIDVSVYTEVVLGCTHFKLFRPMFERFFKDDCIYFDGEDGTVRNLVRILKENHAVTSGKGSVTYYNSGRLVKDTSMYKSVLKRLKELDK